MRGIPTFGFIDGIKLIPIRLGQYQVLLKDQIRNKTLATKQISIQRTKHLVTLDLPCNS